MPGGAPRAPQLKEAGRRAFRAQSKKTVELFKKYGVLTRAEVESRYHIAVEKYVKQLVIEAETMTSIARTQIIPAALRHQRLLAETVTATEGAGVECDDTVAELDAFARMVTEVRAGCEALESTFAFHDDDAMKHALHIRARVRPAMAALRVAVDALEPRVAADLWPLPTYRELLFLK